MLRIGLIGVGGIMNGVHIPGYETAQGAEITAICDINPEALQKTGDRLGIPAQARFTDYKALLRSGLVDAVDIATHDAMHCPIAKEAASMGIPFSSEKPMGMNYAEVKAAVDEAKAHNLPGAVCFSWHYRYYVRKMKELVASGTIGKLYHIYIRCIKNSGLWDNRPLEWRFDSRYSASGVMGDLSSHMFDIARFAGAEFEAVCADGGIFIKERPSLDGKTVEPVTTWDWCNVLARMEGGANATFQISRTTECVDALTEAEFYGEKGKVIMHFGETTYLKMQLKGQEPVEIPAEPDENQSQAYINILTGHTDGYEATLEEGMKCQAVLDAAKLSAEEQRWVKISEITGAEA